MLQQIQAAWLWLGAQHETLPFVLVTLFAYLLIYCWRKLHPRSWRWVSVKLPFADQLTKGEELAHNVLLSLPSVVLGGVVTALATGADVGMTIVGMIAGAFAPLLHHTRKALPFDPYRGALPPAAPKEHERVKLIPPGTGIFLLAFAVGSVIGLTSCSPSAMQAQRDASNIVAKVANDTVEPMLLAAYRATGMVLIENEPTRELAQAKLQLHQERWKPIWAAWEAFKLAHTVWQNQIDAGGDTLAAAAEARKSYCELRGLAAPWKVELPDFPGPFGCGGSS